MKKFFREMDMSLSGVFSPVVKWVVYMCVGLLLVNIFAGAFAPGAVAALFRWLGASVSDTILKGRVWQLVTYAFVHAGFMHLFFNMLALYFFGQRLEYRWGSAQFARFCIIVGSGAVLTHLGVVSLRHLVTGAPMHEVIVGFSGVIYGIMIACALYYPDDIVYLQFLIPIKMKYLVLVMGILTFLSASGTQGNIAHLTHLGGLVFGFLYVKVPALFDWIPKPRIPFRKKEKFADPRDRWRNMR